MDIASQLREGSFRGIPFLVITESTERGKKIAQHEYPNSDVRFAEELGKIPPVFNLNILLHGDDVVNRRASLEDALETPGIGRLVHPFYGGVDVTVGAFSSSSDQRTLGEVRLSVQFITTRAAVAPEPVEITNSAVSKASADARESIDSSVQELWIDPVGQTTNIQIAETATGLWTKVRDSINSVVGLVGESAAEFNRIIATSTNNVFGIIQDGQSIASSLRLIMDSALDAARAPEQLLAAWESLARTDVFPIGPVNTPNQRQREANKAALNEHLRLTALVNMYEAAVFTDFTTDIELDSVVSTLDDMYVEYVMEAQLAFGNSGLTSIISQDARNRLNAVRNLSQKIFVTKAKNVYEIINLETGLTSMSLLTYSYYGNLDLIGEITSLNEDVNHAAFSGVIKGLSI